MLFVLRLRLISHGALRPLLRVPRIRVLSVVKRSGIPGVKLLVQPFHVPAFLLPGFGNTGWGLKDTITHIGGWVVVMVASYHHPPALMCLTCAAPDCALAQAFNHPNRKSFDIEAELLRRELKERKSKQKEWHVLRERMEKAISTVKEWQSARRKGITTTEWKTLPHQCANGNQDAAETLDSAKRHGITTTEWKASHLAAAANDKAMTQIGYPDKRDMQVRARIPRFGAARCLLGGGKRPDHVERRQDGPDSDQKSRDHHAMSGMFATLSFSSGTPTLLQNLITAPAVCAHVTAGPNARRGGPRYRFNARYTYTGGDWQSAFNMATPDSLATLLPLLSFSCGYCVVDSLFANGTLPVAGSIDHHISHCPSIPLSERPVLQQLVRDIKHRGRDVCYVCHLPGATHGPRWMRCHSRSDHPHAYLIPQALWAIRFINGHIYRSAMRAMSVAVRGHSWDTPDEMALWISDNRATEEGNSGAALVRFLQAEFHFMA
ncbi:hypothetical protein BD626DRAFT_535202 [Schizophyllum amplum]|uniref:Uncharacterized protein n=1 Tax=Schizophyllum amplum TaxID=97359 RepID=A0A550CRC6_9AGAR|nr:hypothetical protein BD626DRAFT_535202 [Auriculariopsis ampla]